MAAFASGLANVGAGIGKFLSNPAVQKGIGIAKEVSAPFAQQPLTPAQGAAMPQPGQAGGFNSIRQPQVGNLGDTFRSMYANKMRTTAGAASPDVAVGLGTGAPARGSL